MSSSPPLTFDLTTPPLRSGLENDLGDAGSIISDGGADAPAAAAAAEAELGVSGMEFRDMSARELARGRAPTPEVVDADGPLEPEEVEEEEGVEGEGVEKRRREEEESTAKSGSVSLVRRRSSAVKR